MKKQHQRFLSLFICTAILSAALAGCGAGSSADAASSENGDVAQAQQETPSGGAAIELFSQKPENIELYDTILRDFMEEHPDIEIVQTTTVGGATYVARVATNDLPDIGGIYFSPTYTAIMKEDLLVDLTGESFLEKIDPNIVENVTLDGQVYLLPVTLNAFALYYNRDIFEEHGLAVPETIEELVAICEQLQAAGVTPMAFAYKDTTRVGQCFERLLGGAVDHEVWAISERVDRGEGSHRDYPELVNYLNIYHQLAGYTDENPLGMDINDTTSRFANGQVAMLLDGTWSTSTVDSLNPDLNYDTVLAPTISGVESATAGTIDIALSIAASSPYIEECKTFLEYFVREDVAQKFAEGDKNPNVVTSVTYRDPHLSNIIDAIDIGRFVMIPATYWPAGYKDELQLELQQFIMDGDVDAFIDRWDKITVDFYQQ